MEKRVHEEIGIYDGTMHRAPDFELWVRAMASGVRFGLVEEKLTHYRLHSKGVTHADPRGTLLEITYLLSKHLMPIARTDAGLSGTRTRMFEWAAFHPEFDRLTLHEQRRLLASLVLGKAFANFAAFAVWLTSPEPMPAEEAVGDAVHTLLRLSPHLATMAELRAALDLYERTKVEWFVPRLDHLQGIIDNQEVERTEQLLPRIAHLEAEVEALRSALAGSEALQSEQLRPRIAFLERELERRWWDRILLPQGGRRRTP